ncbi:hypothetical protein [Amniculibacterium sp. G2-70]|uniref:hypothetical protein n=1 Tax=Amniculibacterium sp. G2-70 TaxID=2767188 RepID=UPI00397639D4
MPISNSSPESPFVNSLQSSGAGGGSGGGPTFQFPKGTEKFYQENYPAFYDLVKNQLPKLVNDTNFMSALSKASGFSMDELIEIFQYGKGMEIKIMDLAVGDAEYLYGGFTEGHIRNTAAINTPVADWFEKANKNSTTIEGITNLLYMSSLIAHEAAHWGDDVKRTFKYKNTGLETKFGDVGSFFENRAFGGYIGSYNGNNFGFITNYVKSNFQLMLQIFNK